RLGTIAEATLVPIDVAIGSSFALALKNDAHSDVHLAPLLRWPCGPVSTRPRHHRPGLREASSVRGLDRASIRDRGVAPPGPRRCGAAPSGDGVEAAWIVLEDPALARLAQVRALRDDLHRVGELAVPVVVVRGVDDDVFAQRLHHPRHAALVGIAADEAAAGEEVLARLAVDPRRLLGRQLPVLVEALEPEGEPADAGLQESDAQLREAVQDAAQRE